MSIRKGSKIIAGSGGSGDGDSIKNQNPVSPITKVYDWIGTLEEYEDQQVAELHPTWVCFILDDTTPKDKNLYTNRNVGDIFFTTRLDEILNGAVECNGATYNISDYTGKNSIGELLINGKLPYVSLSEYETLLSTNGVVGVFGWDGDNSISFRVPKLESIFVEAGNTNNIGEFTAAGLPNVTGGFGSSIYCSAYNTSNPSMYADGPFTLVDRASLYNEYGHIRKHEGENKPVYGYSFDASLSSSIYGNSNTVQPKSVKYRPMIQLSIGFTDEAMETCQNVKSDVENLKETKANIVDIPDLVTPDYANPTIPENDTIYLADKTYLVTLSCGAGSRNRVIISQNSDMSNEISVAEIYITSTGNIFFTVSGIIPKGWYYKVIRAGGSAIIYPIGQ